VGIRLAYPIEMDSGRKIVPEARVGWTHEFMDDQASFNATIQGQPPVPKRIVGKEYSRDTLVIGGGLNIPLSASSTAFVDYDGSFNPDIATHTISAGVRFTW
jgi:outer membrane autotransporter protein